MTLFVFALPFEAAGFRTASKTDKVWVLGCAGNAAAMAFDQRLEHCKNPALVISAGLAGALKPDLAVGDLVVSEDSDENFLWVARSRSWKIGRIATVGSIASTRAEKSELAAQTGADVCDMENALFAAICRERGIPFAGVRVIGDSLSFEMPVPPEALTNPSTGKPDLPTLAASLLRHPGKIPSFFQMVSDASRAKRCLHNALSS